MDPAKLGAELKRRREETGISIRKLALLASVSPTHLSDIENGNRSPSQEVLRRITSHV